MERGIVLLLLLLGAVTALLADTDLDTQSETLFDSDSDSSTDSSADESETSTDEDFEADLNNKSHSSDSDDDKKKKPKKPSGDKSSDKDKPKEDHEDGNKKAGNEVKGKVCATWATKKRCTKAHECKKWDSQWESPSKKCVKFKPKCFRKRYCADKCSGGKGGEKEKCVDWHYETKGCKEWRHKNTCVRSKQHKLCRRVEGVCTWWYHFRICQKWKEATDKFCLKWTNGRFCNRYEKTKTCKKYKETKRPSTEKCLKWEYRCHKKRICEDKGRTCEKWTEKSECTKWKTGECGCAEWDKNCEEIPGKDGKKCVDWSYKPCDKPPGPRKCVEWSKPPKDCDPQKDKKCTKYKEKKECCEKWSTPPKDCEKCKKQECLKYKDTWKKTPIKPKDHVYCEKLIKNWIPDKKDCKSCEPCEEIDPDIEICGSKKCRAFEKWTTIWTDPHMQTLDGKDFLMNWIGPYWLIKPYHVSRFAAQVWSAPAYKHGKPLHATLFVGLAVRVGNTIAEVLANPNRVNLIKDGNAVQVGNENGLNGKPDIHMANGARLVYSGRHEFAILSPRDHSAVTVRFTPTNGHREWLLDVNTRIANQVKLKKEWDFGLLGNWNGIKGDSHVLQRKNELEVGSDKLFFTHKLPKDVHFTPWGWKELKKQPGYQRKYVHAYHVCKVKDSKGKREIAGARLRDCIYDVMITGERSYAKASIHSQNQQFRDVKKFGKPRLGHEMRKEIRHEKRKLAHPSKESDSEVEDSSVEDSSDTETDNGSNLQDEEGEFGFSTSVQDFDEMHDALGQDYVGDEDQNEGIYHVKKLEGEGKPCEPDPAKGIKGVCRDMQKNPCIDGKYWMDKTYGKHYKPCQQHTVATEHDKLLRCCIEKNGTAGWANATGVKGKWGTVTEAKKKGDTLCVVKSGRKYCGNMKHCCSFHAYKKTCKGAKIVKCAQKPACCAKKAKDRKNFCRVCGSTITVNGVAMSMRWKKTSEMKCTFSIYPCNPSVKKTKIDCCKWKDKEGCKCKERFEMCLKWKKSTVNSEGKWLYKRECEKYKPLTENEKKCEPKCEKYKDMSECCEKWEGNETKPDDHCKPKCIRWDDGKPGEKDKCRDKCTRWEDGEPGKRECKPRCLRWKEPEQHCIKREKMRICERWKMEGCKNIKWVKDCSDKVCRKWPPHKNGECEKWGWKRTCVAWRNYRRCARWHKVFKWHNVGRLCDQWCVIKACKKFEGKCATWETHQVCHKCHLHKTCSMIRHLTKKCLKHDKVCEKYQDPNAHLYTMREELKGRLRTKLTTDHSHSKTHLSLDQRRPQWVLREKFSGHFKKLGQTVEKPKHAKKRKRKSESDSDNGSDSEWLDDDISSDSDEGDSKSSSSDDDHDKPQPDKSDKDHRGSNDQVKKTHHGPCRKKKWEKSCYPNVDKCLSWKKHAGRQRRYCAKFKKCDQWTHFKTCKKWQTDSPPEDGKSS